MNIEKEKRQEAILLSLKKLDFLTRDQIEKLHPLGQTRNAQRILRDMSEYLSFFVNERKKVYYLNKEGRERVEATKVRKKTPLIYHYLMRNDLYINQGRPSSWRNEMKIKIPDSKISIVADAVFIKNKIHHFVEVDYRQSMSSNATKVRKYQQLSEFNPQFVVMWITLTPYRKKKLESMCNGLNVQVYLWDDIK
ncbi:replication-relaxation family protein [Fredinandcohnia humi]